MAQIVQNQPAMLKTQVQSLGQDNTLEKGMAILSSILAWRMPQTEEPGRLQSMRSRTRLTNTHNIYSLSIYNMYVNKHIYPYF